MLFGGQHSPLTPLRRAPLRNASLRSTTYHRVAQADKKLKLQLIRLIRKLTENKALQV